METAGNNSKPIRAILLAAGQGKRMKSKLPKVLHEILGRPILARVMTAFQPLALEHIHIVVGHEHEQVEAYLQKSWSDTTHSTHLQAPQLGTGDAVRKVVPALSDFAGTLIVSVSDTPLLTSGTLQRLLEAHKQSGAVCTILSCFVEDVKNYGRIVRAENGDVQAIVETQGCNRSPEEDQRNQ